MDEPRLEPIPDRGAFIDYDGHGYYANVDADGNGAMASAPTIKPSKWNRKLAEIAGWTHVVWFNR